MTTHKDCPPGCSDNRCPVINEAFSLATDAIRALDGAVSQNAATLMAYQQSILFSNEAIGRAANCMQAVLTAHRTARPTDPLGRGSPLAVPPSPVHTGTPRGDEVGAQPSVPGHTVLSQPAPSQPVQEQLLKYFKATKPRRSRNSTSPHQASDLSTTSSNNVSSGNASDSTLATNSPEEPERFYAVTVGREPGVYRGSQTISANISGIPGGIASKHKTIDDAMDAYRSALYAGDVCRVEYKLIRTRLAPARSE